MSRMSAREILPGKLYQRGQFLTWTADQKKKMLDNYGVTLVVNMWSKTDPDLSDMPRGFTYLNWLTSPSEVPANSELYAEFIAGLIKQGHTALIHCEAGRGRSVWLTTRVIALVEGLSRKEALDHLESVFPKHSLRPELKVDLR